MRTESVLGRIGHGLDETSFRGCDDQLHGSPISTHHLWHPRIVRKPRLGSVWGKWSSNCGLLLNRVLFNMAHHRSRVGGMQPGTTAFSFRLTQS